MKCFKYWPENETSFGEIHVKTVRTELFADYTIRYLDIKKVRKRLNLCWFTQLKTPQTCCKLSMLLPLVQFFNMKLQQNCQFQRVASHVATQFHLQTLLDLLKQLAASLWMKNFENQLSTSLLTTCNKLAINKLSQAMRTHPAIGFLITNLLKVNCAFLVVYTIGV